MFIHTNFNSLIEVSLIETLIEVSTHMKLRVETSVSTHNFMKSENVIYNPDTMAHFVISQYMHITWR